MSLATVPQTSPAAPAVQADPANIISMIARAASDPSVSLDKMERLFEMHQRMEADRKRAAYNSAMALAQAEIMPVVRDRRNDHTRSVYATLEAIDEAIRPVYTRHGFSLSFDAPNVTDDGKQVIVCDVLHSEGHQERKTLSGALDTTGTGGTRNKTDIQGLGSTVSYLRRYLTCMVFNVTVKNEDKDGNSAAKLITAEQYEELLAKLEAVNGDKEKFAERMKVESLSQLPASRFAEAERAIEQRAAKLRQERESANAG